MTGATLALVLTVSSLIISASNAETTEVRASLIQFMAQLNAGSIPTNLTGWNTTSDPCVWERVVCNANSSVNRLKLNGLSLTGTLDATSLCVAKTIQLLFLDDNNIMGPLPEDISECSGLAYLSISDNHFTGVLPESLSQLTNLRGLDISGNSFVGSLPQEITTLPLLMAFVAQDNLLAGEIPDFNFDNFVAFNVSNNLLSGEIPKNASRFGASSFSGNGGLCGPPLPNSCTSAPAPAPGPAQSQG